MCPVIDKKKTGRQIRELMEKNGLSVEDVRRFLSLGCVQSVYHWLDGTALPSLDNLYCLSELFHVPMDAIVAGNRTYHTERKSSPQTERLYCYVRLLEEPLYA